MIIWLNWIFINVFYCQYFLKAFCLAVMSSRPTSASSTPAMQPQYKSVLTPNQDQLLTPKQDQWHKRQTIVGPSSSCPSLDDNEIPLWPQYCWTHNNHTYLVRSGEETFSFLLLKRQIFLYWLMTWQYKSLIPSLLLLFLDKIWEKVQSWYSASGGVCKVQGGSSAHSKETWPLKSLCFCFCCCCNYSCPIPQFPSCSIA